MLKSTLTLARILVKNNLTINKNAATICKAAATQTFQCRFMSECRQSQPTIDSTIDSSQQATDEKRRKVVEAEVTFWHAMAKSVLDPAKMQPDDWDYLYTLQTASARKRFCRFLFVRNEMKQKQRTLKAIKQAQGMEIRTKTLEERKQNTHISYGLGENTLMMRIRPATVHKWLNRRLMRARLSGPKLIFDCSFDDTMSIMEIKSAGRQLNLSFVTNRRHKMPFDLRLCNANTSEGSVNWLKKHVPNLLDKKCPLPVHQECFTELFPTERLVYLSPDSENVLTECKDDDIFIVGTIVDKGPCHPLSLARAKSFGLRHARLPLESHVQFASGAGKRLTLVAMTKILLEWRQTNSWKEAFKHIEYKLAEPIQ